eukprot:CFRG3747T1
MSCPVMGRAADGEMHAWGKKGNANAAIVEEMKNLLPDCEKPFSMLNDCYEQVKYAGKGDCVVQSKCATECLRVRMAMVVTIGKECSDGTLDIQQTMSKMMKDCQEKSPSDPHSCTLQLQKYLTCATKAIAVSPVQA